MTLMNGGAETMGSNAGGSTWAKRPNPTSSPLSPGESGGSKRSPKVVLPPSPPSHPLSPATLPPLPPLSSPNSGTPPKTDENSFIKTKFPFHYSFTQSPSPTADSSNLDRISAANGEADGSGRSKELSPRVIASSLPPLPPTPTAEGPYSLPLMERASSSRQSSGQLGPETGQSGRRSGPLQDTDPYGYTEQNPLTPTGFHDMEQGKFQLNPVLEESSQGNEMLYHLRETPTVGLLIFYALQHVVSLIGSMILIPHLIVPAAGGNALDLARLISTSMMVSGIATLLHIFFGSRLPLAQGSTFAFLVPAMAVINAPYNIQRNDKDRFEETMRDLMGAVICAALVQMVAGYSGFTNLLIEFFSPVVIAPTIAAVGFAYYTKAFVLVGTCVEIGIPQLLMVVFFALHLRRVFVGGAWIFQVHAIPLALGIVWLYAFILTEAGAYNYDGCDMDSPADAISDKCAKHVYTMRTCRTDTTHALSDVLWIRPPYPFQWGKPIFDVRSILVMLTGQLISMLDSIGTYHGTATLVATRPPPIGVVSRGLGMEGLCSALAGIWGLGTGATSLTENIHFIAASRKGSRMIVACGAVFMIFLSIFGHVGALLASIPAPMIGGLLCAALGLAAALGLSALRYAEMGSSRNLFIVGLALLLGLAVPSYFAAYATAAGHGPVNTGNQGVNLVANTVLSMQMVVTFLVAFLLDGTVPGRQSERGAYVWSGRNAARSAPAVVKDYELALGLGRLLPRGGWVGL